jgi:hypothetical protein
MMKLAFPSMAPEILEERAAQASWPDLMRDLGQVQAVLLDQDDNRYQLRTDMLGSAHQAFAAAGVRPRRR